MSVWYLKRGDTGPAWERNLLNPDGTAYDATGATACYLHIRLSDGSILKRTMTIVTNNPALVRYAPVTTDWDAVSGGGTVGGFVTGPALPLTPGQVEHRMEYEVVGPGGARLTFPNGGERIEEAYDVLRIWNDIGQGT